jgi:tight adherence protein B
VSPVSPEVVGAALAATAVMLLGSAFSTGERSRLLARAGAGRVDRVDHRGIGDWIGSLVTVARLGWARNRLVAGGAAALFGAAVGLALAGPVGAVAGGTTGAWVPRWRRTRRAERRAGLIEEELADAMDGIAAALRAGMSPSQALAFAADEASPPLSDALRAVVERESLGMPLDESLDVLARREAGDDVRFAVAVLQLQHRVGGDAPAVLDDAVRTLRQRVAAAGELRSLTAQARLSGTILGLLPIGFFVFMSVVSRSEVTGALSTPVGLVSVVLGLALDGLAFLWIRHLLRGAA